MLDKNGSVWMLITFSLVGAMVAVLVFAFGDLRTQPQENRKKVDEVSRDMNNLQPRVEEVEDDCAALDTEVSINQVNFNAHLVESATKFGEINRQVGEIKVQQEIIVEDIKKINTNIEKIAEALE